MHQIGIANKPGGLEEVISAFERDALHRETLRTQGRRQASSAYDPLSRLHLRHSQTRRDTLDRAVLIPGDQSAHSPAIPIRKEFKYDPNGELISRYDNLLGQRAFTYDAAGRITATQAEKAPFSHLLDDTLRTQTDRSQAITALFQEERFTYDAASNLLDTGTDGGTIAPRPVRQTDFGGISFDDKTKGGLAPHNRLKELNGITFTYDAHGRTAEKRSADGHTTWRYTYNSEHQLTDVLCTSRRGFTRTRFEYDALGRRIAKTTGSHTTHFLWNGMQLLQEEAENSDTTSTYVYEQGTYVPLARVDLWNADALKAKGKVPPKEIKRIYYFHCNASGMPEEVTDRDGNTVWRGRYSVWGKLVFENTTQHAPDGFEQNLRMQGQYADRETGLYYNTFRYYDADMGRFTTEDPIGLMGGDNLYQYGPNPLSWIDPWGWETERGIHGVADDWSTKGAHATSNGIEISIRPGQDGKIVYKPVFSSTDTNSPEWRKAVAKLDNELKNPKVQSKLNNLLEGAKKRWPQKGAEWSHLQKNIKGYGGTEKC